uniref:UDP-N-acetylglucosamine--LPS N-acetylglucosamine transferase n=2 Tax=Aromatoleum toluolicum TaxID=90060 RepID=A0ABX1NFF6_9RHOO|nr:UDP-N-acetylglucosamine--LPS N-acetylglucosamine transferase [Aromatoleum toluolicum]
MTRVLAVASGGGHWVQLMRLRGAFARSDVVWISTQKDYVKDVEGELHVVQDANLWNKMALARMFLQVAWLMVRIRPDVVVTTGAAPGFAAILFGRLFGARTVWIDSIANSETLSTSGAKVGRWAHVWLTQWEHLAKPEGPHYWGAVL